ncbi:MAG: hypothetical protein K8T20_09685 [Planctomycetes bacterium]|nr:hypothetical protein [Planctomycetota bacterium]
MKHEAHLDALTRHPDGRVTLHLRREIASEEFRRCVEAFFGLLEEVARSVRRGQEEVKWIVTVKEGSIGLVATPATLGSSKTRAKQIRSRVARTVNAMSRSPRAAATVSHKALEYLRELGKVAGPKNGKADLQLKLGGETIPLSDRLEQNAARAIGGRRSEHGAVEGVLETISVHGGNWFIVYDRLTDRGTKCIIPLELQVLAKASLGKRVAVEGRIGYDAAGHPDKVEAAALRVLGEGPIPSFEDVKGILGKAE